MKRFYIFLAFLFVLNGASAQPCLPEGITFSTQAQVNSFAVNHPHCTEIGGNVIINGYNITNLYGLSVITSIGGSLVIECNQLLPDLDGLDNLASIGGDLYCAENMALTGFSGLGSLAHLGGELRVANNIAMASLAGLENLTLIGGELWIDDNPALLSLNGLNNVTSVAGNVRISLNGSLVTLNGLESLAAIGGNLLIGGHDHLGSLGNHSLQSLEALLNLFSIGGILEIGHNISLQSLQGLDNIAAATIGELSVHDNDTLSSCEVQSVCSYLAAPGSVVNIWNNASGCDSPAEVEAACIASSAGGIKKPAAFAIYPNPANVSVIVEIPAVPVKNRLLVFDVTGRVVVSMQLFDTRTVIDVSGLPSGVYFARYATAGTVETSKLIKQ